MIKAAKYHLRDISFQLEEALALDGLETISRGLSSLIARDPVTVRSSFRRGEFFNGEERGLRCRGKTAAVRDVSWMQGNDPDASSGIDDVPAPVTRWIHGRAMLRRLREVGSRAFFLD